MLRDFQLNLKKDGAAITVADYLEQALADREDKTGRSRRIAENNRIRQSFRALFRSRECYTLVRPVSGEDELRKLGELEHEQLRPEFATAMGELRGALLARAKPKQLFGVTVTGLMLHSLAQAYVDAINDGGVPDIKQGWATVMADVLQRAHQSACDVFVDPLRHVRTQRPPFVSSVASSWVVYISYIIYVVVVRRFAERF